MTLLKMSIYGAVIILAVLIIRAITLHKLPKKTFLILWAVALVRLLVPFEISSDLSLYSLLPEVPEEFTLTEADEPYAPDPANPYEPFENYADYLKEQEKDDTVIIDQGSSTIYLPIEDMEAEAVPLPDTETDAEFAAGTLPGSIETNGQTGLQAFLKSLVPHLPLLWAAGASLCAAFFLICYLRCLREFRMALPVTEDYAAEWLKQHPLRRTISIRQSDKISAPLTYGFFRPVILLPKNTDWSNTAQLDYVLYHEFTHIRRFDLLAKLVMIAALCLHWFNPFVWAMYVFFNRDLELSCDDLVVKHFGESKSAYAGTLIGMEEKKNYGTPLCNHFSKTAIEERITAIMKSKKTTIGMVTVAAILVAAVIITLITGRRNEKVDAGLTPTPTESITPVPSGSADIPTPSGTGSAKPTPAPGQDIFFTARNYVYREDDLAEFVYDNETVSQKDDYDFVISSFVTAWGTLLLSDVTINLEEYAGGTAWWCMAAFYDGDNVYLEFVPAADVEEAHCGILHVTIPVNSPTEYTVHPAGDFHAQKASAFWFSEICKIQDKIYFNNGSCNGTLWVYDITTGEMTDLSYVNEKMQELANELCADFGWENDPDVWFNVGWHSTGGTITYEANVCKEMDTGTVFLLRVYYKDGEFLNYSHSYKGPQEQPPTQDGWNAQLQELFYRYQEMQKEFFSTNLKVAAEISADDWVTINGTSGYTRVLDERFPTLQSVIDYMETICTPQFAMDLRIKNWEVTSSAPTVIEHNGILYTRCYDGVLLGEEYRFSPLNTIDLYNCTLSYEAYIGVPSNKTESGTVYFEYTNGNWHVSNHTYTYYHNYVDGLDLDIFAGLYENYITMKHEFYYGSLESTSHSHTESEEVTINGVGNYYKVTDERFPTLQRVIDYMETICTPDFAKNFRKEYLNMETDHPALAELNGELYTQFYVSTSNEPASFRFTDITILDSNRVRVGYHGYQNSLINVRVSGTIDFVSDGGWRIDSVTTDGGNPYFDAYNGEKLQVVECTEKGSGSPAVCNDIIFYRAAEDETLEDVLIAMKTAILEQLTVPSGDRAFTVTDYVVTVEQPYSQIDMSAWRLPSLTGYYSYEGTDLVSFEDRQKESDVDAEGRVPFLAQGSEEVFCFILLEQNGVYRLQREETAKEMLNGSLTY